MGERKELGGRRAELRLIAVNAPSTVAVPDDGGTSPSSIAIVVVLPAPFGPMKPAMTPVGTSMVSESTPTRRP